MKPKVLTDLQVAFSANVSDLMPSRSQIPKDFDMYSNTRNSWVRTTERWFFSGLPKGTTFKPKPGIDGNTAVRHLKAILGSFEPKHEHKIAAVAYLLSEWFEAINIPDNAKSA